uniref:tigger transposable element-derived protein 4-like n=1 Tax=Myxine glutinosa TaxID=7769 RepID=UPI00358F8A17
MLHEPHRRVDAGAVPALTCSTRKRKSLTLEDRVKVINMHDVGRMSSRAIAKAMDVGKTQIQLVIKDKESILASWESGNVPATQKYLKAWSGRHKELNSLVWEWYQAARAQNIHISGRMVQAKAMLFSRQMNINDFCASNGWLTTWQARHNVRFKMLSGQPADVKQESPDDWSEWMLAQCEGFNAKDVFAAREMALFHRQLPNASISEKVNNCNGGKNAEDRMTVLVCCSAFGEKLSLLVVGKSAKPSGFQGRPARLPVSYECNSKSWMTERLFGQWLHKLNNAMWSQSRKIVLLVDECLVHSDESLSNVKLVFLPSDMTSQLQPCETGIIQALKRNYRKRFLHHVFINKEDGIAERETARRVTLLDTIKWMKDAWDGVDATVIVKCFQKCGFCHFTARKPLDVNSDPLDATPGATVLEMMNGMSWDDYVNCDADLVTSSTVSRAWEDQLLNIVTVESSQDMKNDGTEVETSDEEQQRHGIEETIPTPKQCLLYLDSILRCVLHHGYEHLVCEVMKCQSMLEKEIWEDIEKTPRDKMYK